LQDVVDKLTSELDNNKAQLTTKDNHYQQQLHVKDEQLTTKDTQIAELMQQLSAQAKQIADLTQMAKREQKRQVKGAITKKRSEPERRRIAMRQNWKCNDPYGKCTLPDDLAEYEVDHIIPTSLGGADTDDNLQALCPGCHRIKTNLEIQERGVDVPMSVGASEPE
jgi:5-methylcytosine-specific restriction endonuclease McrA